MIDSIAHIIDPIAFASDMPSDQAKALEKARAVLVALETPTDAMCRAGRETPDEFTTRNIFRAMIAEAGR